MADFAGQYPELSEQEHALLALYSRRTVTSYTDQPITPDTLGLILQAGRYAPSSGNIQNWEFILITDPSQRTEVCRICYDQYWMQDAPAIIAIVGHDRMAQRHYDEHGDIFSVQNCAFAAANMIAAASILGIASAYVGSFDRDEAHMHYSLHPEMSVHAFITLGHAREQPSFPGRKDLYDIVYLNAYGNRIANADIVKYDIRILDLIKERAALMLPPLDTAIRASASNARFHMLHKELELKNRQIESLKNDLHALMRKEPRVVYVEPDVEGPWGYFVLKAAKGLEYPADRNVLLAHFDGFSIKGEDIQAIMQRIKVPVLNHQDLLKKVKECL